MPKHKIAPDPKGEAKDALKDTLLGNKDADELKVQTQALFTFLDNVNTRTTHGANKCGAIQEALELRTPFTDDGELTAIIRGYLKECIEGGYIRTKAEGAKEIRTYLAAVKQMFENDAPQFSDPNALTDHMLVKAQEKVNSMKEALITSRIDEAKREEALITSRVDEAKREYAKAYTKFAQHKRIFTSTRAYFDKTLKQHEQKLLDLGVPKKEVQSFVKSMPSALQHDKAVQEAKQKQAAIEAAEVKAGIRKPKPVEQVDVTPGLKR